MKICKFYVILLFISACLTGAANAKEFRLLLTSFDPFGGSAKNTTQEIVAALKQMSLGEEVRVDTCNLPVIYDVAATTAMNCVEKYQPDAVISFGEAACSVQIETAATNLDDTPGFPDNAGQVRDGSFIIEGGVERTGFEFPVHEMYCAIDASFPPIEVSNDPGAFVCNNTAYHLSEELKTKHIPFTFIHVPNSRCAIAKDLPTVTDALAKMITESVGVVRHENKLSAMPSNKFEAVAFLQELQNQQAPACKIDFAKKILTLYEV